MKLIKTINTATSAYAGGKKTFVEFSLKPSPKYDDNNNEISPNKRYYVLRMLSFEGPGRTDYPFIQRNEHVCYHRNAENKVVSVDRIVCPTTTWAKNKLYQRGEHIERGYCPICQYSFEKNREAWKIPGQPDRTSIRLANETKNVWCVYLPVFVVSDPHYPNNNQHLRVLRLTGDAGKDALERLTTILNDYMGKGINCYNGDMGINIGFLCESIQKTRMNKNGEVAINKKTGKPYVYNENVITDIRPMVKKQYAYPEITDSAIDELDFDGMYGTPAAKDELAAFLNHNWLDIGGGEDDFGDSAVCNSDFESPSTANAQQTAISPSNNTTIATNAVDDEFSTDDSAPAAETAAKPSEQSTDDMIRGIIGASTVKSSVSNSANHVIPPTAESIRNETATGAVDYSDLPF